MRKDFVTLFRGRGDVYGHNEGRCVKEPLTPERFAHHLDGREPIGVYPLVPMAPAGTFGCVWGCSDFDTADAYEHATAIREAFLAIGIAAWVERSRSKGYHVWVFATAIVPAVYMRNMFLAAHQVAGVPATEVNPKQTTLGYGQYGNYVRLPYPDCHNLDTDRQRVLYEDGTPIPIEDFLAKALESRITPDHVRGIAAMYVPPAKPAVATGAFDFEDTNLMDAMKSLSTLGQIIWRDGPLVGKDRSSTLARLGHECVRSGLNPSQTRAVVKTADQRWGKYHLRPNGDMEIDKLVIRVHS